MGRRCDMEQVARCEIPEVNKAAKRRKEIAFLCTKYFFLVFFSILFVFPIYALVINSFMPNEQIMGQRSLWPDYFYFGAYSKVFTAEYLKYLANTLLVCVLNVGGVCIASSLTAYALAKMDFFGKNFVFACIMGIVLLPSTVISIPCLSLIPRYILLLSLKKAFLFCLWKLTCVVP